MSARARVAVLLALLGALLLLGTSPTQAHAYLVGSDPTDGGRLQQAPHTLRLDFSEHVVLGATRLMLADGQGHVVELRDVRVVSEKTDSEQPAAITATLPSLAPEAYRLGWETLSADDLHRTSGVIRFGIGRDVEPAAAADASARWSEVLLHGLMLLATALAAGPLLLRRALSRTDRRLATLAACTACALAVALLLDQVDGSGASLVATLSGGYGGRWLVRAGGLLALAVAAARSSRAAAWAGLVVSSLGAALLGHVGASATGTATVVLSTVHVAAALLWSGGVLWLAVVVAQRRPALGVVGALQSLRSFGAPAAACLSVVVVTGVALSSTVVASVDAALTSAYGRALMIKVLLVAGAGSVALLNHRHVRGPHDLDMPGRTVAVEAAILGAVLCLTGFLASAGTATDPSYQAAPAPSQGLVGREVADLQVGVGLSPNEPGRSVALVDVYDTRRPAPGPVTGVDVVLGTGRPRAATPLGDGHWSAPVAVTRSGAATLRVTVHRAGLGDVRTDVGWTVGGGPGRHPLIVSQAPLEEPLLLAAGGLLVIAIAGWLAVAVRRVRMRRPLAGGSPVAIKAVRPT